MKEIGQKLKDKREENGVSVEEAAEDLKMRPSQITNLEEGNTENFKDSLFLKYFIRDSAKYLGLDSEKILDEYNEYMFDVTSKISLDDIEEAKKNKKEDENKEQRNNDIKECEAEISSLKTRIKWLEENIKLYEQQNSESDARLKVKKDEVQQQIENFVGARIFE